MFRIQPQMPVQAYKTYELSAPLASHWRKATCAEVDCPHWTHGWATTVVTGSDDEALIRRARRRFTAEHQADGFTRFMFEPGQPCFAASRHQLPLEREPLYVVRGGDWRANTGRVRTHTSGESWVDDFATHQDQLATRIERG